MNKGVNIYSVAKTFTIASLTAGQSSFDLFNNYYKYRLRSIFFDFRIAMVVPGGFKFIPLEQNNFVDFRATIGFVSGNPKLTRSFQNFADVNVSATNDAGVINLYRPQQIVFDSSAFVNQTLNVLLTGYNFDVIQTYRVESSLYIEIQQ
jgi:hypothetical protein